MSYCEKCGLVIKRKRNWARFCSETCRKQAENKRRYKERKPNYHLLIAAAPAMLEALHDIAENSGDIMAVAIAKAAIEAAEGVVK